MISASALRLQIESTLSRKMSSALTPAPKMMRPIAATGIAALDDVLLGGLPIGAISEMVGPECSGRTSVALSFLAQMTQAGKVCCWIDVANVFDPASAAAAGVDLKRLLWVRCRVAQTSVQRDARNLVLPAKYLVPSPAKKGLHGGGFGPHPRSEANGLSDAVTGLLRPQAIAPRYAGPRHQVRQSQEEGLEAQYRQTSTTGVRSPHTSKPWSGIEQALRSTDLLLQTGGFGVIVLDMGSLAPESASRVPLATWFRYRAAAERMQSSILLLTQYSCAKSSAELLLRFQPAEALCEETTVFTGIQPRIEVARHRFAQVTERDVVPLHKPLQNVRSASWQSRTTWAGRR